VTIPDQSSPSSSSPRLRLGIRFEPSRRWFTEVDSPFSSAGRAVGFRRGLGPEISKRRRSIWGSGAWFRVFFVLADFFVNFWVENIISGFPLYFVFVVDLCGSSRRYLMPPHFSRTIPRLRVSSRMFPNILDQNLLKLVPYLCPSSLPDEIDPF
jgi:hypothetical protein